MKTHLNQSVVNGMLKGITDPALRETYGHIINGDFPYKVYCMNPQGKKHPAGQLIGYIDARGRCIDELTANKAGIPIAGIETSRDRFDGRKGFRCYCGNWSIQSSEEQGVLKQSRMPLPPNKQEISEIFSRIQKNGKKQGMEFINGEAIYDGFRVEAVAQ